MKLKDILGKPMTDFQLVPVWFPTAPHVQINGKDCVCADPEIARKLGNLADCAGTPLHDARMIKEDRPLANKYLMLVNEKKRIAIDPEELGEIQDGKIKKNRKLFIYPVVTKSNFHRIELVWESA